MRQVQSRRPREKRQRGFKCSVCGATHRDNFEAGCRRTIGNEKHCCGELVEAWRWKPRGFSPGLPFRKLPRGSFSRILLEPFRRPACREHKNSVADFALFCPQYLC